jgi:hypothetical protein
VPPGHFLSSDEVEPEGHQCPGEHGPCKKRKLEREEREKKMSVQKKKKKKKIRVRIHKKKPTVHCGDPRRDPGSPNVPGGHATVEFPSHQ